MALPEGRIDLAYFARTSNNLGQPGVQIECVDARPLEEPVEIISGKPPISVADYRQEEHPLVVLKALLDQEEVQVWAEAEAMEMLAAQGIPSEHRGGLNPCAQLAIWTTPPNRDELDQVLERLSPERVYLFAVEPETGVMKRFLERLAGLVKHAINTQAGLVRLGDLAAATAQTKATVHAGIVWLWAQGHVKILEDDGAVLKLENGNQGMQESKSKATRQLSSLLKESAAFRSHFARANAESLINPIND